MNITELPLQSPAVITGVGGSGALRQHLLDLGLLPGAEVLVQKYAPMGDPVQLLVAGYSLTVRRAEAELISISKCQIANSNGAPQGLTNSPILDNGSPRLDLHAERPLPALLPVAEHPGYGEGGRFHDHSQPLAVAEGETLRILVVGNPNCGKSAVYNSLTGQAEHVGNFPGVTVSVAGAPMRRHKHVVVYDTPGLYSLTPYTDEERATRDMILGTRPHCIINVVDATSLRRNLYLTMQLMELDIPMVLAVNMMDELVGNGGDVRVNQMERLLGLPVLPVCAVRGEGIHELADHALHVARYGEAPQRHDFCSAEDHGGAVHRSLHAIMHLIDDHCERSGTPVRFAAAKLAEGDADTAARLKLSGNEQETIEHLLVQMETERGLDRAAAIAEMRYDFTARLTAQTVKPPRTSREATRTQRIDSVLTGRHTAFVAFATIMALVFWLTFDVIGGTGQDWCDQLIAATTTALAAGLQAAGVAPLLQSLIIDGICAGVGAVASFVPLIVTLFFFISLLEDTGYMARIAFVTDRLLRRVGLTGRSIVPLLVGFGCSVPAVMASRTLPSVRDRRLTILLTPFISCTAKLPVYALFCSVFFRGHAALVMCGLYLGAVALGILAALVLNVTVLRGQPMPFVMELPNYRLPQARTTLRLLWDKASDFITGAFTVIFLASIVVWVLQTFTFSLSLATTPAESILAVLSSAVAPVFAPLGFDDWRAVTAFVSGVMRKESVASTLAILAGPGGPAALLSAAAAPAFLVFYLLYTPCVASLAAIRRELGTAYCLAVAFGQCGVAYVAALITALCF